MADPRNPNEPVARRTDANRRTFSWVLGLIALVLIIWFLYAIFSEPRPGVDVEPRATTGWIDAPRALLQAA